MRVENVAWRFAQIDAELNRRGSTFAPPRKNIHWRKVRKELPVMRSLSNSRSKEFVLRAQLKKTSKSTSSEINYFAEPSFHESPSPTTDSTRFTL